MKLLAVRKSALLNGRLFATAAASRPRLLLLSAAAAATTTTVRAYGGGKLSENAHGAEVEYARDDRAELQDFYLSILSATASRRDARSYIQRFTPPPTTRLPYAGLTPAPKQRAPPRQPPSQRDGTHVNQLLSNHSSSYPFGGSTKPSLFADEELHVALVKIRDIDSVPDTTLRGVGRTLESLKRLGLITVVVLDDLDSGAGSRAETEARAERIITAIEASRGRARRVDGALTTVADSPSVTISLPQLLLAPLSRGVIPILTPLAFDPSQKLVRVDAHEIVKSLTHLFSPHPPMPELAAPVQLDRLIFLDPLGGIPAPDRPAGAHVFVNMEQEYDDIAGALAAGDGNKEHLKSLQTLRTALSALPPTSSAVITTPAAAAAAKLPANPRTSRNPLIHNLLTDKPIFSSSLPTSTSPTTQTTVLRHGTPLLLFGDGTKLTDPEINLEKLVALIEDSFGRTLDVEHYLARVNEHIAGLIIAGDYEGAAIVTWETPPSNPHAERVCYLDKFAVASRSQGIGGVADVVFKAMTAGVQPGRLFGDAEGIVWRSRRTNVVNKWYFERAKGTWKLPDYGDMWTMFWTTQDVATAMGRFRDYADVCGGIQPSLREPIQRQ